MLNCCQPLLAVAVPHEQTHAGLEQIQQIQQQLTQFNASLGEAPGPELGQSRGSSEGVASTFWVSHGGRQDRAQGVWSGFGEHCVDN